MWHGHRIHVDTAVETPFRGVDTEEDLLVVRALLRAPYRLVSVT